MASHSTANFIGPDRPCWHCRWFVAMTGSDNAFCGNPTCSRGGALAHHGCVQWEREPFVDDSDVPPAPVSLLQAWLMSPADLPERARVIAMLRKASG